MGSMIPFKDKVEYFPWCRGEDDREAQEEWQSKLSREGDIVIGKNSFVSQKAIMLPSHFVCGDNTMIAADAFIRGDIEIGSDSSVNSFAVIAGKVRMGDMVRIASHVSIFGFNHGHENPDVPICKQAHTSKGIEIGDDVWIGANVVIVDGVKVGAHSLLAAGAVITKDVPPYSIMGGNPARVIRDRRHKKVTGISAKLSDFGKVAHDEFRSVLLEAYDEDRNCYVDNQQNRKPTSRAWCDATEIAGFFAELPDQFSRNELIDQLQAYQNPETGCFDRELNLSDPSPIQRVQYNGYDYLSIGYALEVLGSHLKYKNQFLEEITNDALVQREGELNWKERAWGSGSWNDHLGTAAYHDLKYHGGKVDLSGLFGWLSMNCNRATGLWGSETNSERWLQPVNGFYRLTRGTYAQFGQPLPYPEESIDTILAHCRQNGNFIKTSVTACNVLDIVHPLWLCSKETDYRQKEITSVMEAQVESIISRWISKRGFAFKPEIEPGLQGTEMWLSILYIAADYLGKSQELGYSPKGVHRTEVALEL